MEALNLGVLAWLRPATLRELSRRGLLDGMTTMTLDALRASPDLAADQWAALLEGLVDMLNTNPQFCMGVGQPLVRAMAYAAARCLAVEPSIAELRIGLAEFVATLVSVDPRLAVASASDDVTRALFDICGEEAGPARARLVDAARHSRDPRTGVQPVNAGRILLARLKPRNHFASFFGRSA